MPRPAEMVPAFVSSITSVQQQGFNVEQRLPITQACFCWDNQSDPATRFKNRSGKPYPSLRTVFLGTGRMSLMRLSVSSQTWHAPPHAPPTIHAQCSTVSSTAESSVTSHSETVLINSSFPLKDRSETPSSKTAISVFSRSQRLLSQTMMAVVAAVLVHISPAFAASSATDGSGWVSTDASFVADSSSQIPAAVRTAGSSEQQEQGASERWYITDDLERLAERATAAFNRKDFAEAEMLWGEFIAEQPQNPVAWRNRADARVDGKKFTEAVKDYSQAIELVPSAADLFIGRGIAYEGVGDWAAAVADYSTALDMLKGLDAFALTFRGNAYGALGEWSLASKDYEKAADLFLFTKNEGAAITSRANQALAMYEVGKEDAAVRMMKGIVRRMPGYADIHAALAAIYWRDGQYVDAYKEWDFTCDKIAVGCHKYKDLDWVARIRRWPPVLVDAMSKFLAKEYR